MSDAQQDDQQHITIGLHIPTSAIKIVAGIFVEAVQQHRQGADVLAEDPRDQYVDRTQAKWLLGTSTRTLRRRELDGTLPRSIKAPSALAGDYPAGERFYPAASFRRSAERLMLDLPQGDPGHISRLRLYVGLQLPARILRAYEESGQLPSARQLKTGQPWGYPREEVVEAVRALGLREIGDGE